MTAGTGHEWPYPGSRWWKFDFHTHTPASADYGKGGDQAALRRITPEDWLLGFMRAGMDCVAVTDHNSGEWIDRLKSALSSLAEEEHDQFRPLYLFPGVEVTANGNIHVLALFDTDKDSSDIDKLLGDVRYRGNPGQSDRAAEEAPVGVVEAICKAGAVPILAHVDGPSGAWQLSGNTLGPLLDTGGLFAIEVVDRESDRPALYRQRRFSWAEVLGSDSHHPTGGTGDRFPGSHYTWVKMAQPSLEGLRLALLDGQGFSIRRSDEPESFDPFTPPPHCIEAIEVKDARYMGRGNSTRLAFSPWLNALVGGRGTGKSTVIHALRLASRRGSELQRLEDHSAPRLTFERFGQVPENRTETGGLTEDTAVQWTVTRDGVRHRVHWRQSGSVPVSEETAGDRQSTGALRGKLTHTRSVVEETAGDGQWKPSSVPPDRIPIRILSQGQIAELAGENQQALLQVIDEAAGVDVLHGKLEEARNAFLAVRARIREMEGKLARRDDIVVKRDDVERKLKRFEESGHTSILTTYRTRSRQRREMDRHFEVTEAAAARIEDAVSALVPEDLSEGPFDKAVQEDKQAIAIIGSLADGVRDASRTLREAAQSLRDVVAKQRDTLAGSRWQAAVDDTARQYQTLVETLRAEGVTDPNEYGRLTSERQSLDIELEALSSLAEARAKLLVQSTTLLEGVLEARRGVSAARDAFLTGTLANNRFVGIGLRRYGNDLRVVERSLRKALNVLDDRFEGDILATDGDGGSRGCVAELLDDLTEDSTEPKSQKVETRIQALKDRLAAACAGQREFGGHFNNYLARECDRSPGFLDKLLTWFPEDALQVEYSRTGEGTDFHPIVQASDGQRSAAMLAFLLAHGDEPLVLDQPEDDLDNHLIYDLVVRQMQENKRRRQIIVVTHNPNIVVNGDAEMLHVLDFRGGQCRVVQAGALQEASLREEVCRVMEGGREAFERRYRRLGRDPSHV